MRFRRHFKVKILITELHLVWTGGQGGVRLQYVCCAKAALTFFYSFDSVQIKMTESIMAPLALSRALSTVIQL